jgi:DNA-binding transcriptional LysR family regulator
VYAPFVAVVEAAGFSGAARRLGVSKALISKQVNQLEEHLDVRLLHRTTRHVRTTSIGQAYFEQCRPLLSELDDLEDAVQSNNTNPKGELRVTAPITFAELHLMTVVSNFSRRFPEVKLNLDLTDRLVDLVEERIDVAIRIGTLTDSSLVARKLGNTSMLARASPTFLSYHGEPTLPQQLTEYPCVVDSNYAGGTHWTLGTEENAVTTDVATGIIVNSARAACELVLAGHGIGFLPSFVVADDIAKGKLKRLLSDYPSEPLGIYAVYPHRKHLAAKVRLFIDAAIEHCNAAFNNNVEAPISVYRFATSGRYWRKILRNESVFRLPMVAIYQKLSMLVIELNHCLTFR